MRWIKVTVVVLVLAGGMVAARAVTHPDSKTESIEDGCQRTDLALLGDAALTMLAGHHPTAAASWVYVDGDNTPKTVEGSVLSAHTAGTDLFGVHDTYDLNIDVRPDPEDEGVLSSRNAEESPPQIHNEWEPMYAPLFAWPSVGDRVRNTGALVWDCGHWQQGEREFSNSDHIPTDPLGEAGIEEIGGEEIEIHPISELATWRRNVGFQRGDARAPVRANRLDVAISNQGGKAKAVAECALLSRGHPEAVFNRLAAAGGCSPLSKVAGHDYTYELKAPGARPSRRSRLVVHQSFRYSHDGPRAKDIEVKFSGDAARIKVPFGKFKDSRALQDFGATWHAWWSDDTAPQHRFRITVQHVTIRNNLDGDKGDGDGNPSITAPGEWNMYINVGGHWTNLHDPRVGQRDFIPQLGAVPAAVSTPVVLSGANVPPTDLALGDDQVLYLFTDARECDQPGYIDCPAGIELATTGRAAGRSEVSIPIKQLVGKSSVITIRPPLCGPTGGCPEEKNDPALCPKSCYDVTFRIDDLALGAPGPTTTINAASLETIGLRSRYGPAQEEENVTIAGVIGLLN